MTAKVKVSSEVLPMILALDRAGGMPVSKREADRLAAVDDDAFERAIREELL
jgi:hypothetical protein